MTISKKLATLGAGVLLSSVTLASELAPTTQQTWTLRALVTELEENHYIDRRYNDAMSADHLDTYLERLDPSHLYFTAADVAEFQRYATRLDDLGRQGELSPAFEIFDQYERRATERLEDVITNMASILGQLDFDRDEYIDSDPTERDWAADVAELDDRWRKRLKNQVLALRLAEKDPEEIAPTLVKRYENQRNRLSQYNEQDVFAVYANALTSQFDPHTSYFSPRRAENFDIDMRLSLEGIGAVLQNEDEYVKVVRVVPAGPADKQSDLKAAELIIAVGQGKAGPMTDVIGWRLDDVVDLVRGKKGTVVRLDVIPAAGRADEARRLTITRNEVQLEEQAAQSKIIEINDLDSTPRKVGVIDIPAFYLDFEAYRKGDPDFRSTTRDVAKLVNELNEAGVDGLVIDLRGNGGGSLREANELTGLFIEYGPTVQIRGTGSRVWRDGKRRRGPYYDGPVAIMIDRLSASASEIFAGALQDYGRAIVVGDRSFGKGTVQTLLDLPEGQLKITESKFYRISGDSTQHRGVIPDISYPSLLQHDEIGESSLDKALDWDRIAPVRHKDYGVVDAILPTLVAKHTERANADPDFQYIWDQKALAEKIRGAEVLPLNEAERIAQRTSQEIQYLAIENARRQAKGLDALASLDDLVNEEDELSDVNSDSGGNPSSIGDDTEEDEDVDALITETARILTDAINLSGQVMARADSR
ncbi:MAG: carboxy terminal-processing peptidase [Luminiphilus sp.]|nr:carboxy terminal-processing peptidase [Luminiphilus sp.]